jgi:predicted AAA+ superfamily ATPase
LTRLAKGFPIIAITCPRQAGKTTLARNLFKDKPYISLENPDEREFALTDPKRFLARFPEGAILDKVQRCTQLLSWLQGLVDERQRMGDFVLTGSAQFSLIESITQTLAGRVARVELLPLSASELGHVNKLPATLTQTLFQGGYPTLYDRPVSPQDFFSNYVATYVERDVRQLIAVRDLGQFQTFVKMCAARTGQLLNLSALWADCGKRLVKTPKLYFLVSGLAAWLMGIRDAQTLETHAARGALFEIWVVSELYKQRLNAGLTPDLYFWRDNSGQEIDVLCETTKGLQAIEIKSGSTYACDWFRSLKKWQSLTGTDALDLSIVYGGINNFERESIKVWGWKDIAQVSPLPRIS